METKVCTNCKEEKELCQFNKNKTKKDGYNNICKDCSREKSKQYYNKNKDHHKNVVMDRKKKLIKENQIKMFDYFKSHPCVDCGETDPIVLEFDHRDGVEKSSTVGRLITTGCSWVKILNEIEKCDVRCANCHRRRTPKQFGWYEGII